MSNTSITNLQTSDTFQVWINKTNEIINLVNENVMLAGPGAGFTVQGNSTLSGTFTANTLISDSGSINNISITTIERSGDADDQIISASPIKIQSSVENILDLQSTTGNRPIFRMINGGNARWTIAPLSTSASSGIGIGTESSATPQMTLTQGGRLSVNELQGNGSLITNISANSITGTIDAAIIPNLNASKITSGTLSVDRIPNLSANKITSGTIAGARLPDSATRGEISLANLTNPSSSVQGFISGQRFRSALTWNNVSGKPSTFNPSSHTHSASEITSGTIADARLPDSATRVEISLANVTNPSSSVQGFITGRRFVSGVNNLLSSAVKVFRSNPTPISNSQLLQFNHNLGNFPDNVVAYLICKVPEGGYQVGDRIQIKFGADAAGQIKFGAQGVSARVTNSSIFIRIGAYGPSEYVRSDSGGVFILTSSRWNLVIIANRFF